MGLAPLRAALPGAGAGGGRGGDLLTSVCLEAPVTPLRPVVAVAHDMSSIGGDTVGVDEVRTARPGVQRAQVLHPRRRGPAKGARLPAGVTCISDDDRSVGGNVERLAADAPEGAEILHPACRGPAEGLP